MNIGKITKILNPIKSTLKGNPNNILKFPSKGTSSGFVDAGHQRLKQTKSGPGSFSQDLSPREYLEASARTNAMMARSLKAGGVTEAASGYGSRGMHDQIAARAMPSTASAGGSRMASQFELRRAANMGSSEDKTQSITRLIA